MSGPLQGVNILDVGTAGVGPWAATLLGYLGANVVKVEGPTGDRHLGVPGTPGVMKDLAPVYTIAQLNKWPASLDLKSPANLEAVQRLILQADVVMDNLRPGAVERMGVGPDYVRSLHPAIISASSPAWGDEGPMKRVPGLDPEVQVFSGFASLNGEVNGRPEMLRFPHLDFNASCFFASTILLALISRKRTGQGQRVSASHLGSNIVLLITRIAEYLATGIVPGPTGSASTASAPHQYLRCQDGNYLAIGIESEAQWQRFCRALNHLDWLDDPRFASNRDRVKHRDVLADLLTKEFGRRPSRWWVILMEESDIPHSYLYDFDSMLRFNQQVLENEYLVRVDVPHQGKMYLGGLPWEFERTPLVQNRFPPPAPGQFTQRVVQEGFGTENGFIAPLVPEQADTTKSPLAGLRVIEACQGVAGPLAGLLLAEAGAEVIKVEPPTGDYARGWAPEWGATGDSAAFAQLNRNKRSVVLDLSLASDRSAYRNMVESADIVLEDFGPSVAGEMGLGYDALSVGHPALIYGAISAYGERGPMRDQPGSELTIQAWTEYWKQLGQPGGEPIRVGADLTGVGTGVLTFMGVLAAIFHRYRTGEGQRVATSMLGTTMCLRTAQWATVSRPDSWGGTYCQSGVAAPQFGYQTKDRPIYFSLNNCSEEQYYRILEELGMLDEVIADPRFGNGGRDAVGMGGSADEVKPIWDRYLSRLDFQVALDIINGNGGMAAELRWINELFEHPQVKALDLVAEDAEGGIYLRAPWRGPWQQVPAVPAPSLSQRTEEVRGLAISN